MLQFKQTTGTLLINKLNKLVDNFFKLCTTFKQVTIQNLTTVKYIEFPNLHIYT